VPKRAVIWRCSSETALLPSARLFAFCQRLRAFLADHGTEHFMIPDVVVYWHSFRLLLNFAG
jgi:hypothetical protein